MGAVIIAVGHGACVVAIWIACVAGVVIWWVRGGVSGNSFTLAGLGQGRRCGSDVKLMIIVLAVTIVCGGEHGGLGRADRLGFWRAQGRSDTRLLLRLNFSFGLLLGRQDGGRGCTRTTGDSLLFEGRDRQRRVLPLARLLRACDVGRSRREQGGRRGQLCRQQRVVCPLLGFPTSSMIGVMGIIGLIGAVEHHRRRQGVEGEDAVWR